MSFRELRNFTEIMRSLGYPRLVSMENFRTPNFELVADCLYWLAMRYDPAAADISDDISTERDRVAFLKATAHFMLQRAHIKLNIKRLYAADGYAVKELLKIASVLYASAGDDEEAGDDLNEFTFNAKMFDAKVTRALTSEITQRGAALYDALEREPELKEARMRAVGRNMDIDDIERAVREAIAAVGENVSNVEGTLANLQKDEKSLEQKIEKRQAELERGEKRLSTLQSVRPAYMDDYEKLQVDLQALYVVYLERFRNLEYLESLLETHRRAEQERVEESERELKRMQKRLREEELRILRGEAQVDEANIEGDVYRPASEGSGDDRKGKARKKGSKHVKGSKDKRGKDKARGTSRVVGSIMGYKDGDSDSDLSNDDLSDDGSGSTHVSINEDGSDDDDDGDSGDLIEEDGDDDDDNDDDKSDEGDEDEDAELSGIEDDDDDKEGSDNDF